MKKVFPIILVVSFFLVGCASSRVSTVARGIPTLRTLSARQKAETYWIVIPKVDLSVPPEDKDEIK